MLCQSKADVQDCKKIDYKVKKNQPNKKKIPKTHQTTKYPQQTKTPEPQP